MYTGILIYFAIFIIWAGILILIKNVKLETIFVIAASAIGICYIIIIPPYAEQDGEAHFNTIYKYSNYILGYDVSNNRNEIVKEKKDIIGNTFSYPATKGDYYEMYDMIMGNDDIDRTAYDVYELDLEIQAFPIVYCTSIIGLTLGRLLGLKFIYVYYLTRICNFAIYIFLTYWAIKIIPIHKKLLFCIAVLPMAVYQAASVSYDSVVIGTSFLLFALVLHLSINKINAKNIILLMFLVLCMFYNKSAAYFPLAGMVLVIPFGKQLKKKQVLELLIAVSVVIILFVISKWIGIENGTNPNNESINRYSLFYSVEHPIWFVKILSYTLFCNFELYFKGLFGISIFGYPADEVPLVLCMFTLLLITAIKRDEDEIYIEFNNKKRFFIVACALLSVLAICLGAVSWTKIGMEYIEGIQGRYLIPVLLPILFWKNSPIKCSVNRSKIIIYFMSLINVYMAVYTFTVIVS